jgi:hypothetical protein
MCTHTESPFQLDPIEASKPDPFDTELAGLVGNEHFPIDGKLRCPEYGETVTSAARSFVCALGYQGRGIGENIKSTITLTPTKRACLRRRQPNSLLVKNGVCWAQRAASPI